MPLNGGAIEVLVRILRRLERSESAMTAGFASVRHEVGKLRADVNALRQDNRSIAKALSSMASEMRHRFDQLGDTQELRRRVYRLEAKMGLARVAQRRSSKR